MTEEEGLQKPPGRPVHWFVVTPDGTQRRILADTAFAAAAQLGLGLSECQVERVK